MIPVYLSLIMSICATYAQILKINPELYDETSLYFDQEFITGISSLQIICLLRIIYLARVYYTTTPEYPYSSVH